MLSNLKRLFIVGTLFLMGLSSVAYAQPGPNGPRVCPPFEDYLSPTFLDFLFPGLSTSG